MCFNDIASVFFQFSFMRHQRSSRMYLSYSRQTTTLRCFPSFRITASQDESQGLVSKSWAIWKEMGSLWGSQFVGKRELLSVSSTTAQGLLGQVPEEEHAVAMSSRPGWRSHTGPADAHIVLCTFIQEAKKEQERRFYGLKSHTQSSCWGLCTLLRKTRKDWNNQMRELAWERTGRGCPCVI